MSFTTINLYSSVNGTPEGLDSVELSDEAGAFGVKRNDNNDIVVAAGQDFITLSEGVYQYAFTDPAPAITYTYVIKIIRDGGSPKYYTRTVSAASTVNQIYSIPVDTHYSSEAEVMRMLGEHALNMMMEDWEQSDKAPIWEQILSQVDANIDQYVTQHYKRENIISSPLIRTHATTLACQLLSIRRGNPGIYQRQVETVYDSLDQIRTGRLHVPGCKPNGRKAPVVRQVIMQPSWRYPARISMTKSTGGTPTGNNFAYEPFYGTWPYL